jgi:hypothetical protein
MPNNMTKPNATFIPSINSTQPHFPGQIPDPSSYKQNFDQLLVNRGIRFIHSRAIPCPNLINLDDNSHDPNCPHCDGSGIFYYAPREIIGTFISNSIEKQFEYNGTWEVGTSMVTMPAEYSNGDQADFGIYDRLQITDYTVRLWEKKQYEPRTGNTQQARYPISKVDYLVTITNALVKEFVQGVDFTITTDGLIQWIPGHTPTYDSLTGYGQVYGLSYFANPIYVVLQPMRELRVTQQLLADGTKVAVRLPQNLLVKRDFLVNKPEKLA